MPVTHLQSWLRQNFQRWGLPERLRVDNGHPWGNGRDLPPAFALWLLGLGVQVVWNPPGRPQANGHVERFHGLQDQWGEPATCGDWETWGRKLAWVVWLQRERYPACGEQSRGAAHPELRQNPRRFEPAQEATTWQVARAYASLSGGVWRRLVNRTGQISLYNRGYQVGAQHRGETVWVRFAAETHEWLIVDRRGQELRRYVAAELAPEAIQQLRVGYLKPFRQRQRADRGSNPPASIAV